ncbi:MAG TPA: imidazole glycerol phosphate synthase subunit HisH [Steroidobacteraceae bacterium]|nr:imidazole glycerol phosphate synthase subunit HisH [Steroidobacteraceae bacterium]
MSVDAVIIDSGGANLASLQFAFERLRARTAISSDPLEIRAAPRIVLPGVGSATAAMQRLRQSGLAELLPQLQQPVLGICLGMQLLFSHSAEGDTGCLGVLPECVARLQPNPGLPVPHMGWNQLSLHRPDPLLEGIEPDEYVYFVHSFAAPVSQATLASTRYGTDFSAVVRRGNFWGTQFHPERSATAGSALLANFLRLT